MHALCRTTVAVSEQCAVSSFIPNAVLAGPAGYVRQTMRQLLAAMPLDRYKPPEKHAPHRKCPPLQVRPSAVALESKHTRQGSCGAEAKAEAAPLELH